MPKDDNEDNIMFVFRNYTVERFFPKDYTLGGYDDISYVPTDVDGYVWFYQQPICVETERVVAAIEGYGQKLCYVLSQIAPTQMVVALTMERFYSVSITDDDHRLCRTISAYNESLF